MKKKIKPSILIAVPCYEGHIHSFTANALFSLGKLLDRRGIRSDIITPTGESYISLARNKIADTFLISKDYTHLFCLDSDILFDPEDLFKLIDMDVNFASGIYRLKKSEIEYCYKDNKNTTTDQEITEVSYVGAGFSLLSRELFNNLINSKTINKLKGINNTDIWDFYSPIEYNGFVVQEDISFCKRCTNIGEKIMINRTIHLGHFGGAIYG